LPVRRKSPTLQSFGDGAFTLGGGADLPEQAQFFAAPDDTSGEKYYWSEGLTFCPLSKFLN